MGGKQSRNKGCGGEREVARLCGDWWAQYEPDIVLKRTPGSGGWAHASAFRSKGDLVAARADGTRSAWPFFVEVKRFEGWSVAGFRAGRRSPVWGHWNKAAMQAADESKIPMLWVRQNRSPWYVLAPVPTLALLQCPTILTATISVGVAVGVTEGPFLLACDPLDLFRVAG